MTIDYSYLNKEVNKDIIKSHKILYSTRNAGGIYGKPMYNNQILNETSKIENINFIENKSIYNNYIVEIIQKYKTYIKYDLYNL